MKVGTVLPALHSVDLNLQMMRGLEQAALDSLWVPDHLLGVAHPALWADLPAATALPDPDAWLDPFCLAASLSSATELPLGTCVTDSIRRRGADLARTALTLQQTSRGGFVLGIGSGEVESTLPFGYSYERPVGRLEEALREIRSLLDTGRMPGDGVGRTGLAGYGTPQVWVAAQGPRSLRLTGRYGDGWIPPAGDPQEYGAALAVVLSAAEEAARPAPTAAMMPLVIFGASRDEVLATLDADPLRKLILLYAPAKLWRAHGLDHPAGPDCRGHIDIVPHELDPDALRAIAPRIPTELVTDFLMIGNAQEVVAQLEPYRQAGLEHVVICDLTGFTFRPEEAAGYATELARAAALLHDGFPAARGVDA